jgi:predicted phosphodiesterase
VKRLWRQKTDTGAEHRTARAHHPVRIPAVLTALVSDLHLGTAAGSDVVRHAEVRKRLVAAVSEADRIVILGDLLEMRERPAQAVLAAAGPFLEALGEAAAGREVVIVPGNHDHELVAAGLDRLRLDGGGPLPLEATFPADVSELSRRVAEHMPRADVVLAYPGLRLRDDVYATHGHYLDVHLTVPRIETVVASAVRRFAGGGAEEGPQAYEAILAPIYAFAYSVVQGADARPVTRGGHVSRAVYDRANPKGRPGLGALAVSRVALPAAVALVNALGMGPFRSDISPAELRRAGLRAMAEVVERLGIEADHVLFGHTHRVGPLAGETEGWSLDDGTRLMNTGSWLYEPVFVGDHGPRNPYWPGWVTLLRDEGPPEQVNALADFEGLRELAG